MIRIKLFEKTNQPEALAKEVNDWLEENRHCSVKNIKHRVTGRMDTTTVVMVEYDDGNVY